MLDAIKCIKAEGLRTVLLTNNFWSDKNHTKSVVIDRADQIFDMVRMMID